MPSVMFRPHTLSVRSDPTGGYDGDGDFVPSDPVWSCRIPCRYEPNGRAATIPVGEDKGYVYEYTVYLGVRCPDIGYGQMVRIFDRCGDSIGDFRCRGFHRGQLNARLWV